jgi:hypothetical protein
MNMSAVEPITRGGRRPRSQAAATAAAGFAGLAVFELALALGALLATPPLGAPTLTCRPGFGS